ncbi:MAG: glycosyltransferase family 2 protein [Clostridia bacterium]|nr:glycosyltransferase family 2 protein [Clostridia bacterium]
MRFARRCFHILRCLTPTNIRKAFRLIRVVGIKRTVKAARYRLSTNLSDPYINWMSNNDPSSAELEKQRRERFVINPKISILVPVYNTPINFFEELIISIVNQTYKNWELCLEDGSPEANGEIAKICKKDKRIKYNYTGNNLGIAGNTNEALKRATGDYIALLDHDDFLPPNCLYEIVKAINDDPDVEFIYTDEDKFTTLDKPRFDPHFKPDFAIDTLRAVNYICHFSVFRRDIMEKLGGERMEYDGAQDYDLIIRMAEIAHNIKHIPKILYHWRVHDNSTSKADSEAKPYAFEAGIKVLQDHLKRIGIDGTVSHGATLGTYRIDYKVVGSPKVTILIPNYNEADTLKVCVDSILKLTTYKNYEIAIIENNSTENSIFDYYDELEKNDRIKVLRYPDNGFNYSRIINFGIKNTDGEYIVQLNNDTELLTPDWLEKMVGMCQREDVGCVGVKLYYPDNTIQHAGVILGMGGIAGHLFKGLDRNQHGYFSRDSHIQNMTVVTAACMMSKRSVYEQVGFMDEKLAVAFNDVDFCMKVISSGKLIIYNPFVEFIHYESKSRGFEDTPEKVKRFNGEISFFQKRWKSELKSGDKYYNMNFRLDNDQYAIKEEKVE